MLPFIKKNKAAANQTGVITQSPNSEKPNDNEDFLETCAEQLIHAVHMQDAKAVVFALQVILEQLQEVSPKSNPSPHSYESQNLKAGKNE